MLRPMRVVCLTLLLSLALGVESSFAQEEAGADGDRARQMEELLQAGIDCYQDRQYTQARAKFDEILALDPTNEEAFALAEMVGNSILSELASIVDEQRWMGRAPLEIILRSRVHEQALRLTPEHIADVTQRALDREPKALIEIQNIGQYAVPNLLEYLRDRSPQDKRINAIYLLTRLSHKSINPLCEALKTKDEIQRQNIVQVLAGIRPTSPRVVAPLKLLCEREPLAVVKQWAMRALKAATGQEYAALRPAIDYYYLEANRYYLRPRDVEQELDILNETYWQWDVETQTLTYRRAPRFALPGLLAERLVYEAFEIAPKDKRFPVLLASLYLQKQQEVNGIRMALQYSTLSRPDTGRAAAISKVWDEHMQKNADIATTLGPDYMLAVLLKALKDGEGDVAVSAIEQLEATATWERIVDWAPDRALVEAEVLPAEPAPTPAEAPAQAATAAPASPPATPAATTAATTAAASDSAGKASHPLRLALRFPNRRIRIAAANCLMRIGYPASAPDYSDMLPILLEGAMEDVPQVVLVISSDIKLREHLERSLTEKGVQVVTAPDGRQGAVRATEYPPKDAIFIDGDMAEFEHLQARLEMMRLSDRSPLPLTIITSQGRARVMADQFAKTKAYRVEILANKKPDEPKLFERVASIRDVGDRSAVVLITNENQAERARLKSVLREKAEALLNPGAAADLDDAMRAAGSSGILSTYINVFLDDELSGFDAMRTIHALRSDPRSRPVPVAVLTDGRNEQSLKDRFKEMTKGTSTRLISAAENAETFVNIIREMAKTNTLSTQNYVRERSLATAIRSADALNMLQVGHTALELDRDQIESVKTALELRADVEVRIRLAEVLGHFKARPAEALLVRIAGEQVPSGLKAACIRAVGRIDPTGRQHNFKLETLKASPEKDVQEAAAWALALEQAKVSTRLASLTTLRVGLPSEEDAKAAAATDPATGAAAPAGEPSALPAADPATPEPEPEPAAEPADTGTGGWGDDDDDDDEDGGGWGGDDKDEEPAEEPQEKETDSGDDGGGWGDW